MTIAWLYVTLMIALMEKNLVAGVLTFFFFGLAPCALVLWLFGSPLRRRARSRREDAAAGATVPPTAKPMTDSSKPATKLADEIVDQNNGADSRRD